MEKRISDEKMKNCYLQRELDMLKQERTRETWLLKNDLHNLEEQLKEQKKAHQDDVERLQKVVTDTEEQFADYLRQIKTMGEEKERRHKELEDLRGATQKLVDMLNPPEEGKTSEQTLLERLLGASQKVASFLTEAPAACVSHALAFVKSFWPEAQLEMFAQGVAAECTEEQFN
ncbi:uncharacterized protein LOC112878337 [Panicum hallii]|uniref:uncharacterized protein LOC112878337 n=1 Tax=Panicum hallii TaxID=206008 RepID=UPI000DF4CC2D|nr:uncharacterized protein LOC112878337 [Panicum hallii]